MQKNDLTIYCDGGSRGNPGPAASAFVVTEGKKIIYKESKYLGVETNNVAEYSAVLLAIEWITSKYKVLSTKYIVINLDSQLVERQINGYYKVKNEKLKSLHQTILSKLKLIKNEIKFVWNFRTDNEPADSLVNETLDEASTGK